MCYSAGHRTFFLSLCELLFMNDITTRFECFSIVLLVFFVMFKGALYRIFNNTAAVQLQQNLES